EAEKNNLIKKYPGIWRYEQIAFYTYINPVSNPLNSMLNAWKSAGQDKNSIISNPKFEDYWAGNFKLRGDSPALQSPINFTSIDFSLVPQD
ncbi:MAG: hypothetical protein Q8N69_03635, partial [bacterium]|nr:hypothetical protein [bacterium]